MSTWTGTRPAATRDVERLGDDAWQVVGVADEVVVLGHRQRDAVDVDLLEGVLADEGGRHVPGDRDDRHGVQERGADPGHEIGRARAGRSHADTDPPGDARVAVGRVRTALFVTDQDVAELGVVAEDVVQRQDDTAGVAEEDVDALAEERLTEHVGPDPRALEIACLVEHALASLFDSGSGRRPVARDVAAPRSRRWT